MRAFSRWLPALAALGLWGALGGATRAGGGPENLFLVVNSRSAASQAVANHYISLRQIPPNNVLYLDWDGSLDAIDVETFRQKIVLPVLLNINARGLGDQIDYLIYSSDFPWAVNFIHDLPEAQQKQPYLSGSLTSMTYLMQYVLTRNPQYVTLTSNQYFRRPAGNPPTVDSHGFRAWYGWGAKGEFRESGGERYLLSTMLAVTSGRGNTVPEVVNYLRRSAEADGTRPKGTIYYMRNGDIRSKTREPGFSLAVDLLKKEGVAAEIDEGVLPSRKPDVAGAMIGTANFDWKSSGSTILPGAICEHLTSTGGVMSSGAGQTPLSEFLRFGAAGSSGTVTEPFAIQNKFPFSTIQLHYARGCTLAESYYQSVFGPYQLLIVGDPLCRPWAVIPKVAVTGVAAGETVKGQITITPSAKDFGETAIDHFELFVAGARTAVCNVGDTLPFDSTQRPDGYCELRVVAVGGPPIETQGRAIVPVTIDNHQRTMEFTAMPNKSVRLGQMLKLAAKAPGAAGIAFYHNGRLLEKVVGEDVTADIDTAVMGSGPVTLTAIGWGRGGPESHVAAEPIRLTVEAAER